MGGHAKGMRNLTASLMHYSRRSAKRVKVGPGGFVDMATENTSCFLTVSGRFLQLFVYQVPGLQIHRLQIHNVQGLAGTTHGGHTSRQ